MTQRVYL